MIPIDLFTLLYGYWIRPGGQDVGFLKICIQGAGSERRQSLRVPNKFNLVILDQISQYSIDLIDTVLLKNHVNSMIGKLIASVPQAIYQLGRPTLRSANNLFF